MKNDERLQPLPYGACIAIYGTGQGAKLLLEHLATFRPDVSVAFFLDSYQSGSFMEHEIFTFASWLQHRQDCDGIVIASAFHKEIEEHLLEHAICDYHIYLDGRIIDPDVVKPGTYNAFTMHDRPYNRKYFSRFRLGYDDEDALREAVRPIWPFTMVSQEGIFALADIIRFCELHGPQGAYVECGCANGGASAVMAAINLRYGATRRVIHAFDSFAGLPEPMEGKDDPGAIQAWYGRSDQPAQGRLIASGALSASQEAVRAVVLDLVGYDPDFLRIYAGWFQDTVPAAAAGIGPIAVLRLDGDLYDSTRVCLEQLYEQVVPGGFVYIDDWAYAGCRVACEDFFRSAGMRPYPHVADSCARFWRKS